MNSEHNKIIELKKNIKSTKQILTLVIFYAMKGIYVFTSYQFVPIGQKPWWLSSIALLYFS